MSRDIAVARAEALAFIPRKNHAAADAIFAEYAGRELSDASERVDMEARIVALAYKTKRPAARTPIQAWSGCLGWPPPRPLGERDGDPLQRTGWA
jgi:hypothetical protein